MNSIRRHHVIMLVIMLMVAFVFVADAAAVENMTEFNQAYDQQDTSGTQNHSSLLWNFIKLVIVLGLLIGAAWSIIKLFGRQAAAKMQGNWLHLVDEVIMGQNRGLVLCEIAGKIYALGVTDHNINLLFEINDPQLVKEISETNLEELIEQNASVQDIADKLKGLFRIKQKSPLTGKNFHILMEEQAKKLHSISQPDKSRVINEKRSGLDE